MDLFTLLDVHQLLDGYTVGNSKMVCKKWDWYFGAGITRLPRKVIRKLNIMRRQVLWHSGVHKTIEVTITGKNEHEVFDVAFTATDQVALWRELEHRIPNTYIEHLRIDSIMPTPYLLGDIASSAGNIVVGSLTLDDVTFPALTNREFHCFNFGFKSILALNLEKVFILPEQLDSVFLARAALRRISQLKLPRTYPIGSSHYNFDCSGVTTFLRNALADKGLIELSAYYADFTLDAETVVPQLRDVLKRPHAAMKVFVYRHSLGSEHRQILQQVNGQRTATAEEEQVRSSTSNGSRV